MIIILKTKDLETRQPNSWQNWAFKYLLAAIGMIFHSVDKTGRVSSLRSYFYLIIVAKTKISFKK